MKTNEFFKQVGKNRVEEIIYMFENGELDSCCFDSGLINNEYKSWWDICVYDLKQLIESHELVENVGGLEMAKKVLDIEIHAKHYDYDATKITQLSKAISDVESCQ